MSLGATLWLARRPFYDGLTFARDGIGPEQDFASRLDLVRQVPLIEVFWKRHVCPATTRPNGKGFRAGVSGIVARISQASYAAVGKLLDADDSLAKVLAGNLGERHRNWRDAVEAAGNALQHTSELNYAIAGGNPRDSNAPSLAGTLGRVIKPFPDFKPRWKSERDEAAKYRNYLIHDGLPFTVSDQSTGEVLVLGPTAFARGVNWTQAQASYEANPSDWLPLATVAKVVLSDTLTYMNRAYERYLGVTDPLLVDPAYQTLWGWNGCEAMITATDLAEGKRQEIRLSINASSASMTVNSLGPKRNNISSGGCTSD